jgi:hypothetical protein
MNEYVNTITSQEELNKYYQIEKDERRSNNRLKNLEICTKIVFLKDNSSYYII